MATKSIRMSNTWPSTFSLHLFVLTDKPSFCPGQSDDLNLSINVELSWKCFGVTRVNFSFYLILIYNNTFPSSSTAPQKQSFKILIDISCRIPPIIIFCNVLICLRFGCVSFRQCLSTSYSEKWALGHPRLPLPKIIMLEFGVKMLFGVCFIVMMWTVKARCRIEFHFLYWTPCCFSWGKSLFWCCVFSVGPVPNTILSLSLWHYTKTSIDSISHWVKYTTQSISVTFISFFLEPCLLAPVWQFHYIHINNWSMFRGIGWLNEFLQIAFQILWSLNMPVTNIHVRFTYCKFIVIIVENISPNLLLLGLFIYSIELL